MSDQLLLNLQSVEPLAGDWLLWDSAGQTVRDRGNLVDAGALDRLQSHSRQTPCYVLVPGELVTQLMVTLPVSGASAEAALPYQVEERLACELDRVHIAHERIRAGQPCRVWVVDRDIMDGWLRWLQQSGLRIKSLIPDYAALSGNVILQDAERVLARCGNSAASLDTALFQAWWSLQDPEQSAEVRLLTVAGVEPVLAASEPENVPSLLEGIARNFALPRTTLCQGRYALHDVVSDTLSLLRWPAIAAVTVIVLHWLFLAVSAAKFSHLSEQLDVAAEQLYRETFPSAQRVVNARSQMKSQLNALENQRGEGALLPMLIPVADAYRGQPKLTLTQLVFQAQSGVLRLAVDADDYAAVDAFSSALEQRALRVSRGTFRQNDDRISGQLNISAEATP